MHSSSQSSVNSNQSLWKLFGGVLLVSGTCIGAGMLALPVSTAAGGFYWTTSFFIGIWLMMTLSAFFMLEVALWHQEETNLISMAHQTLGRWAEVVAWLVYVCFLYSLMTAYTAGGTDIAASVLEPLGVPLWLIKPLFVGFFASVVYFGAHSVDLVNRGFMMGLVIAYFGLAILGISEVQPHYFQDGQGKYLIAAMPLMVTSFGFHLLIPSLKTYFNNDVKRLRLSIFLGSLVPLFVYLIWEFIVLGVIPTQGDNGLIDMLNKQQPVSLLISQLSTVVESKWVGGFAKVFTFFAIISSFIGVSLGLFDFFADGLSIQKSTKGRLLLVSLTFGPPALLAWSSKEGFLIALSYAGVFAAILLVIYPALMTYVGRYKRQLVREYEVIGGKALPLLAIGFGGLIIVIQILHRLNLLPIPKAIGI